MVAETSATELETRQQRWTRGGIVGGILLVLLGLLSLFVPFATGLVLSVLLGGALVVGALVHVGAAFSARNALSVIWQVVLGIVYGFAGISILTNPVLGLTTLTLLVIAFFIAEGVVQLVWAVTGGAGSRLWLGLSGAISLVLAVLLWSGFPTTALWAVGVLFGVNLLITGISMIMYGRKQREAVSTEPSAEAAD